MSKRVQRFAMEFIALIASIIIFWIPLYFVIITAMKSPREASLMDLALPQANLLWENIKEVFVYRDYMLVRAFYNSTVLTLASIALLVIVSAMAAFVMQRRTDRFTPWLSLLVLMGLIIPPAIVPTIWVLDGLQLFKTLPGLILVEVALGFPFCAMLYRGFVASIPKEIDEAAIMDGYSGFKLFFKIIMPLLQPVTATVIVVQAVTIFNDFTNPLYFLPGVKNVTVQLTLYNFTSQFVSQYNLLFSNILLITIPPLILFIFFNKRIVAGMTAGAVKG